MYKFEEYSVLVWYIIYCNTITTIALADTFMKSHNYCFFFMLKTFKIVSLGNFQLYTVSFTVIEMLHITLDSQNLLIF